MIIIQINAIAFAEAREKSGADATVIYVPAFAAASAIHEVFKI